MKKVQIYKLTEKKSYYINNLGATRKIKRPSNSMRI